MEDGLVLFYIKDEILYPVVLTKEQKEVFEMFQHLVPQPIRVMFKHPQGEVVNLLDKKGDK